MESIKDLIAMTIPWLPGCNQEIIRLELQNAVRKLCRECGIYRKTDETVTIKDIKEYGIVIPDGTILQQIQRVYFDGSVLSPQKYDIDMELFKIIFNINISQAGIPIKYEMMLIPDFVTEELNRDLFIRYAEAFRDNALSVLLRMPKKPWTNNALAMDFERKCIAWRQEAKTDMVYGGKRSDLRIELL